jgi:CheY-like chemotaxis protein
MLRAEFDHSLVLLPLLLALSFSKVSGQDRICPCAVQTCSDAHEALARLRDTNNHFDLVLSDVVMPGNVTQILWLLGCAL